MLVNSKNHNFTDQNGIIYSVYVGDQTAVSIGKMGKEVQKMVNKVKNLHQPVLILSDISKIGDINLGARKEGLNLISNLEYEKLAIVGVSFITQQLVKAVVIASGRGFKIKVLDTEDEAIKWLKS